MEEERVSIINDSRLGRSAKRPMGGVSQSVLRGPRHVRLAPTSTEVDRLVTRGLPSWSLFMCLTFGPGLD